MFPVPVGLPIQALYAIYACQGFLYPGRHGAVAQELVLLIKKPGGLCALHAHDRPQQQTRSEHVGMQCAAFAGNKTVTVPQ